MSTARLLCGLALAASVAAGVVPRVDPGQPLFLTPYLERNRTAEARTAAATEPLVEGGIGSYSGFLTVNNETNSNMYFWYFPCAQENASVMLWLDGWSTSMLYGVFMDHGPYAVNGQLRAVERVNSWNKRYNMLYIDSLVGTGFSFTEQPEGYHTDQEGVSRDLLAALKQFFVLFPELRKADFYVAGESYAGKYAPTLAYKVSQDASFNLKGLILGNPWIDPRTQMGYGEYLHNVGLIDTATKETFEIRQALSISFLDQNLTFQASLVLGDLLFTQGSTLYTQVTGNKYYYNFLHDKLPPEPWREFVQMPEIRRKMHVGDIPFQDGSLSSIYLSPDISRTTKPLLEYLVDNYRVLLYNGQQDIVCAFPMMENMINSLSWTGAADFGATPRTIWYDQKEVAGYVRSSGHLTEVLVKNAGHMAIVDQPARIFNLVHKFVTDKIHQL